MDMWNSTEAWCFLAVHRQSVIMCHMQMSSESVEHTKQKRRYAAVTINKQQTFTIVQCVSIKVCILVCESSTTGALVEKCLDTEIVYSRVLCIRTATTSDIEPPRLSKCNTHKNDDNHVTCCRHIVAFFPLETTKSMPPSTTPRSTVNSNIK